MFHLVVSTAAAEAEDAAPAVSSSAAALSAVKPERLFTGRIHLLRRLLSAPVPSSSSTSTAAATSSSSSSLAASLLLTPHLVLLLSVPCWLPAAALTAAAGSSEELTSALRVVDSRAAAASPAASALLFRPASAASVVLAFTSASAASAVFEHWNGRVFPAAPPSAPPSADRCLAFYLHELTLVEEGGGRAAAAVAELVSRCGYAELPPCPRCLLRLDTSCTGVVPAFDVAALLEPPDGAAAAAAQGSGLWSDSDCPVCQTLSRAAGSGGSGAEVRCAACSVSGAVRESIWLCLVCGYVGCGRYFSGHAASHHAQSGHRFTCELLQHYVWDYGADGFSHRLLHNRDASSATAPTQQQQQAAAAAALPVIAEAARSAAACSSRSLSSSRYLQGHYDSDAEVDANYDSEDEGQRSDSAIALTAAASLVPAAAFNSSAAAEGVEWEEEAASLVQGKLVSVSSHYSHLLSSELVKQAEFFEQLLAERAAAADEAGRRAEDDGQQAQAGCRRGQQALELLEQRLRQCRLHSSDRRRRNAQQRDENDFLKQINASLISDQQRQRPQASAAAQPSAAAPPAAPPSVPAVSFGRSAKAVLSLQSKQRQIATLQRKIEAAMQAMDAPRAAAPH